MTANKIIHLQRLSLAQAQLAFSLQTQKGKNRKE